MFVPEPIRRRKLRVAGYRERPFLARHAASRMVVGKEACPARAEVANLIQLAVAVVDHLEGQFFHGVSVLLIDLFDPVEIVIHIAHREAVGIGHGVQSAVCVIGGS